MEVTTLINAVLGMIGAGNYIGAVLSIVLIAGFFFWRKLLKIEKGQEPKHEKTDYNKFIEYDSLVMDELENIRVDHNADRAVILELRNGEVNVADIPSMKVYVRNERLKPRIFSISNVIDGVPASFYSMALREMVKGKNFLLPDVSSLEGVDFGLFQNLISSNVKSLYAFPLFDASNVIYGCLILEYCIEKKEMVTSDITEVEKDVARINGEILLMKKVEKLQQ